MQYISESNMNKLLAYGGKDGVYLSMVHDSKYIVAKVKNKKVKKKEFVNSKQAREWANV